MEQHKRLAICFYGITRSLRYTHQSILKNIVMPAQSMAHVEIYSHFYLQDEIENLRTNEFGKLDVDEYKMLNSNWLKLSQPENCLEFWDFRKIMAYGDPWNDSFSTLRNLIHQLNSLREVTNAVLNDGYEHCVFCRPDLRYHDSIEAVLDKMLADSGPIVAVPYWQEWAGLNDRFAVCSGRAAISAYGERIEKVHEFLQNFRQPLGAEELLKYALERQDVTIKKMGMRASRVRSNGVIVREDFSMGLLNKINRKAPAFLKKIYPNALKKLFKRNPFIDYTNVGIF